MKAHPSLRPWPSPALAAIAWCIVVGGIAGGDPMLVVEAVVGFGDCTVGASSRP